MSCQHRKNQEIIEISEQQFVSNMKTEDDSNTTSTTLSTSPTTPTAFPASASSASIKPSPQTLHMSHSTTVLPNNMSNCMQPQQTPHYHPACAMRPPAAPFVQPTTVRSSPGSTSFPPFNGRIILHPIPHPSVQHSRNNNTMGLVVTSQVTAPQQPQPQPQQQQQQRTTPNCNGNISSVMATRGTSTSTGSPSSAASTAMALSSNSLLPPQPVGPPSCSLSSVAIMNENHKRAVQERGSAIATIERIITEIQIVHEQIEDKKRYKQRLIQEYERMKQFIVGMDSQYFMTAATTTSSSS